MARKRTNGRFSKSTRTRRSKPKTNLGNLAVSALVANSITQGMTNTNLVEFFTGNTNSGTGRYGSDGSSVISLPEMLGIGSVKLGGNYATGRSLQTELVRNFKANWVQIGMGVIVLPIAANAVMKIIRKPIILPANRMISKYISKDVKI